MKEEEAAVAAVVERPRMVQAAYGPVQRVAVSPEVEAEADADRLAGQEAEAQDCQMIPWHLEQAVGERPSCQKPQVSCFVDRLGALASCLPRWGAEFAWATTKTRAGRP